MMCVCYDVGFSLTECWCVHVDSWETLSFTRSKETVCFIWVEENLYKDLFWLRKRQEQAEREVYIQRAAFVSIRNVLYASFLTDREDQHSPYVLKLSPATELLCDIKH